MPVANIVAMNGIDALTGRRLSGIDHLRQSIRDILTTPIGSRVMLREYGSRLPRLVDAPTGRVLVMEIIAATAEALQRWEPRLRLTDVSLDSVTPGAIVISLSGIYLPDGQAITLSGIEVT